MNKQPNAKPGRRRGTEWWHVEAIGLVAQWRERQRDAGYDIAHDDRRTGEQLAAAAAFFLAPSSVVDEEVCVADTEGHLNLVQLLELLSAGAWKGLFRGDGPLELFESKTECLDARIDVVAEGVALAMAELERLLRLRGKLVWSRTPNRNAEP